MDMNRGQGSEVQGFWKQNRKRQSVLHSPVKGMCFYTKQRYCIRLKEISSQGTRTLSEFWNRSATHQGVYWVHPRLSHLHFTTSCLHAYEIHFCTRGDIRSNICLFKSPHGSNEYPLDDSEKSNGIPSLLCGNRWAWSKCEAGPTCFHSLNLEICPFYFFVDFIIEYTHDIDSLRLEASITDSPHSLIDNYGVEKNRTRRKWSKNEGKCFFGERSIWGPCLLLPPAKANNALTITYVYIMFRRLVDMRWWPSNNAYIQVCKMVSSYASDTSSALFCSMISPSLSFTSSPYSFPRELLL